MLITRKEIQNLGISQYQTRALTKHLRIVQIKGRKYFYDHQDVMQSIIDRRKNSNIRSRTREQLIQLETRMRHLENKQENYSENLAKIDKILEEGTEAMIRVRDDFAKLDREQEKFQKKREVYRERNNIVPFDLSEEANV